MARPEKCRRICSKPKAHAFAPADRLPEGEAVLGYDEYETIRLIDELGYTQDACARKMGVSRSTVARIYAGARRTLADMLVHGRALKIEGGDVVVCAKFRADTRLSPGSTPSTSTPVSTRAPVRALNFWGVFTISSSRLSIRLPT